MLLACKTTHYSKWKRIIWQDGRVRDQISRLFSYISIAAAAASAHPFILFYYYYSNDD